MGATAIGAYLSPTTTNLHMIMDALLAMPRSMLSCQQTPQGQIAPSHLHIMA